MRKLAILFATVAILAFCVAEGSQPSDEMISVGTHRLQIHREGKGIPAVVIDVGISDRMDKLRPLQDRIARVTQVITYNRAGYGQSEPGPLPRDGAREAEVGRPDFYLDVPGLVEENILSVVNGERAK